MSTLVFDGGAHTLTLFDASGHQVGQWHANNVVDSKIKNLRFLPNRAYTIIDPAHPHKHGGSSDTLNGAFGRFGIIRLQAFTVSGVQHDGVGVHSGRANKGGADHATHGCVRTTDAAMAAITAHMLTDPLVTLTVQGNHDQHNKSPHHPGDHHHAHHAASHGHAATHH
jgi:hypothetical protein